MHLVSVICLLGLAAVSLGAGPRNAALQRRDKLKSIAKEQKSALTKESMRGFLKALQNEKLREAKNSAVTYEKSASKRGDSQASKRQQWPAWVCRLYPEFCATEQGCADDEYQCSDGSCIYDYWECDGWDDCSDAGDEQGCACTDDQFTCNNGRCLPGNWECDNWDDCNDGSDEADCPCSDEEFKCTDNGECIPSSWECDDLDDCSDGSDEADCGCEWEAWGPWSDCNTGCGAGQRQRNRECSCGAGQCVGEAIEFDMCNGEDCFPEAVGGCGTRQPAQANNRIVGGEDAVRGAWPWQAQLFLYGGFTCGGTLVSNKYVVSAAHCFTGSGYDYTNVANWNVQLGKLFSVGSIDGSNGEYESGVSRIVIHEAYDEETSDNDIAVMELSDPLPATSNFVNVACLDRNNSKAFDSSSNCFTTGFGALSSGGSLATILQEANVPLIPRATCNDRNNYDGEVTENMLCAGFIEGGVDSCQGDSGGPLVCAAKDSGADTERWYLVGVTSWGYGCASANYPGVYTDASKYMAWLQDKMV